MAGLLRRQASPAAPGVPDVRADVVARALRPVPEFCEIVDAHLNDVIEQTGEAAEAIVGQMLKIDSMAEVMAGDVARLAGTVGRTESELAQVGASNAQLVDRLVRYFLYRDEQVRSLVDEMRGLKQHVTQIEEVSKATNILALNAMIEAVRAGDAGEGFAVVADEVRKLATRSSKAANDIGSTIADLTARLDAVLTDDSNFDESVQPEQAAGDTAMTRRLNGIAQAQREMSEMVAGILHDTVDAAQQVQQSSDALTGETTGAVGHVQFQDISRQMLEHVAEAVGEVKRQVEDTIGYAEGGLPAEVVTGRIISVEALRSRHVMSRQRVTHGEQAGLAAAVDDTPIIELF
ncbi:methyl-accepting chemotaxis protein [Actinoplanes sp. NPDC049596]|uniref:methyl-accepting chemotaxis protein n=1 Tax=unclassified Actinoplanes TaxID=2626549 RepID=UPI003448C784